MLAEGADEHRLGPIRDNLVRLYGVTSAHEVTLKVVEAREWGFVLRALMREGSSTEKVVLALSFTKDGDGWLRPLHCSGTLKGLRKNLKKPGFSVQNRDEVIAVPG